MYEFAPPSITKTKSTKMVHMDIVKKISMNTGINTSHTRTFLKAFPFAIIDSLEIEGDKVYIQNLGTFSVVKKKGKVDYLDGLPKQRRDKLSIVFHPSKNLLTYSEQDIRNKKIGEKNNATKLK